jgi:hypothetical protein
VTALVTVITTVLRVDEELWHSVMSVRSMYPLEHIITVCTVEEPLGRGFTWPEHVRFVAVPGCGIAQGFNEGISRANGRYVFVLNSGDELVSFDALVELLEARPAIDIAYGDVTTEGARRVSAASVDLGRVVWHGLGFCHGAMLIRASAHRQFGQYDPAYKICMDMDFICRALVAGAVAKRVDCLVASIAPAGVSGKIWSRSVENARVVRPYAGTLKAMALMLKWAAFSWIARMRK